MRYEDMINGLADEMLEKIASEEEVEYEGYEEEIEYEEPEYEVEGEEYEDEATEEEMEALAEEMYMEELQKVAEEMYGTEEDLEKEAGFGAKAKAIAGKALPKGFKNAKANKELTEKALGQKKLDKINPAMAQYRKERNKLVGGAAGAAAGTAGAVAYGRKKVKEKCAGYFEEAEFLKQAAEEAYQEAIMMQDAAVELYNRMEE